MVDLIAVRLFLIGDDHSGGKQAVADAVTLAAPCYAIIDDVRVHGAVLPDLADFNPAVLNQHVNCPLDGSAAALHQG